MTSKMTRVLPLAGLLCSFFLSTAHADEPRMQKKSGQMQDRDSKQYKEITPNAGPRVANGADVWISADFIYWTARQDGLAYCTTGFGTAATDATKGSYQYINWKWQPGFKVGLGLMLGHDGWDTGVEYTWLNHSTKTNSTGFNASIYPLWNVANTQNTPVKFDDSSRSVAAVYSARGSWKLSYNVIDWEIGRNYFISQNLKLRPFVGLKGAWNKQTYTVRYDQVNTATQTASQAFETAIMTQTQKYWGIGIRAGMDTAWHFTKEWSIYGDFALSEMWSQFKTDRKDTAEIIPVTSNDPDVILWSQNSFYSLKPVFELGLGLRWETWFSDDDYHFLIQAGWEEQVWVNFGQFARAMGEQTSGDMSLQGLTLKFRFDF